MGTYENRGAQPLARDSAQGRAYRGSPLSDRLVRALFEHHRNLVPRDLERRLLPMCVPQPDDVVKIKRNVFRSRILAPVICLPDLSNRPPPDTPQSHRRTAMNIIHEVLRRREIGFRTFISVSRTYDLVVARQEICYRIATDTDIALKDIGRLIRKDHTTVINAIIRWCSSHDLPLPRGAKWKRKPT